MRRLDTGNRRLPILAFLVVVLLAGGVDTAVAAGEDEVLARAFAAYDGGDYGKAVTLWRQLADGGNAIAMTALANLLVQGEGVARDPGRAAAWYRRAADLGDAVAQLNLGDMYFRGLGVARDPVEAFFWLGLAARQGNAWARQRQTETAVLLGPLQVETVKRRIATWEETSGDGPVGGTPKIR